MKANITFVMFGDIEFLDGEAVVHRVSHTETMDIEDVEAKAMKLGGCDYIVPHIYDGKITFIKY